MHPTSKLAYTRTVSVTDKENPKSEAANCNAWQLTHQVDWQGRQPWDLDGLAFTAFPEVPLTFKDC
jgi:hypothetical protein